MKHLVLLSFLCLLGPSLAFAHKTPPPLDFLSPDALHVKSILPPPPEDDSADGKADLALYTSTHENATQAELKRAGQDGKNDSVWDFEEVVGSSFTPTALPKTAALFAEMTGDLKEAVKVAKKEFKRPTPPDWADDEEHDSDDDKDKDKFSYPSGHTTRAFVWASLLADLYPDKKAALLAKAGRMGWERVLLGKHYPADVKAGTTYGTYLAQQFLASSKFRSEWNEVRAEVTAHPLAVVNK